MSSTSHAIVATVLFAAESCLISLFAADVASFGRLADNLDADIGGDAFVNARNPQRFGLSGEHWFGRHLDQFRVAPPGTATEPTRTKGGEPTRPGIGWRVTGPLQTIDPDEIQFLQADPTDDSSPFPESIWIDDTSGDPKAANVGIHAGKMVLKDEESAGATILPGTLTDYPTELVDAQPVREVVFTLYPGDATNAVAPERKTMLWPYRVEHGPKKYLEWLIKDPVNLVTRPYYWEGEQWAKFGIGLGVAGVILPADLKVREFVQEHRSETLTAILDPIRNFFTGDVLELAGVGMFVSGLIFRNEKLADTGFLATESVFYSIQVAGILKDLTNRERPKSAEDQYEFNGPRGKTRHSSSSFVSGEVIGAFAFASSVSELWDEWWISVPLYFAAGAVAAHRLDHDAHWLTDVVVAAGLGHAIGKTLVRLHYRKHNGVLRPFITEDSFGLQVSFNF